MVRILTIVTLAACNTKEGDSDPNGFTPGNTPPGMPGISLTPANPTAADDLVVEIVTPATDPDGDEVEYRVAWTVDGEQLEGVEGLTLESMFTRRGERWTVNVTSFDGIEGGGVAVKRVDIENTLPTVESISISPSEAYEKTELVCVYSEPQDMDNDVIDQRQAWSVNGDELPVIGTLTGEHFDKGDEVVCLVHANDGVEASAPFMSEPIIVQNSLPSIVGCSFEVENNEFPVGEPVVIQSNGWNDDDGDLEDYLYAWYVNGSMVAETVELAPSQFGVGDSIYVELTAWDGEDVGNMARSPYGIGVAAAR